MLSKDGIAMFLKPTDHNVGSITSESVKLTKKVKITIHFMGLLELDFLKI